MVDRSRSDANTLNPMDVPLSDACRSTEAVSVPRDRMSIPPQKSAADFTDRPACGLSSPHRSELNYPRRMGRMGERVGGF